MRKKTLKDILHIIKQSMSKMHIQLHQSWLLGHTSNIQRHSEARVLLKWWSSYMGTLSILVHVRYSYSMYHSVPIFVWLICGGKYHKNVLSLPTVGKYRKIFWLFYCISILSLDFDENSAANGQQKKIPEA
jgi:hypothetical protein